MVLTVRNVCTICKKKSCYCICEIFLNIPLQVCIFSKLVTPYYFANIARKHTLLELWTHHIIIWDQQWKFCNTLPTDIAPLIAAIKDCLINLWPHEVQQTELTTTEICCIKSLCCLHVCLYTASYYNKAWLWSWSNNLWWHHCLLILIIEKIQ